MAKAHRVVIIGGGFGGLNAARALRSAPVEVTVIDRRNFHLFQPLLYQVATGSLSPGDIAAPIRGVLSKQRNTRVLLGEVDDINPQQKWVHLVDGAKIPYDSLILGAGTKSTYFGNDQWQESAPSLKTIEEATTIRHKILVAFEAAERLEDAPERKDWMTFAIVGAGATGVELAGALSEIANDTLKSDFRAINSKDAKIILLDGSPRALTNFPEDLAAKAVKTLEKRGVEVRFNVKVVAIDKDGLQYKDKNDQTHELKAKTILWAAGVAASDLGKLLAGKLGAETDKIGRIKVNPDLTVADNRDVYVVGDLAAAIGPGDKPLPGVAQVAMQGGDYAGKSIIKRLNGSTEIEPFRYFNKGDMAVVGRGSAIANLFNKFHLSGLLAWLAWLFVHLLYIVEFENRIQIFVQWGFEYLTFNRGARLITWSADGVEENKPQSTKDAAQIAQA